MKLRYSVLLSMLVSAAVGGIAVHALHAQAKPPVYVIALNQVTDAEAIKAEARKNERRPQLASRQVLSARYSRIKGTNRTGTIIVVVAVPSARFANTMSS